MSEELSEAPSGQTSRVAVAREGTRAEKLQRIEREVQSSIGTGREMLEAVKNGRLPLEVYDMYRAEAELGQCLPEATIGLADLVEGMRAAGGDRVKELVDFDDVQIVLNTALIKIGEGLTGQATDSGLSRQAGELRDLGYNVRINSSLNIGGV